MKISPPPRKLSQGLILLTLLYFTACEEQTFNKQPQNIPQESNQRDVEFAEEILKIYGQSVMILQKDSEFRKILYADVEAAFDGEHNVLFKTLLQENKSSTLARKLNQLVTSRQDILDAFTNIEGKNYYPQVFIPHYEELKASGKLSLKSPTIVIYSVDSPDANYQGYGLDSQENLVETGLVSEAFAKENEVWVVSINERVDNEGNIVEVHDKNIGGRTQGAAYPSARFATMKIDSHKESWAAGASEVHIKRYVSFYYYNQYTLTPAAVNVTSEDDPYSGEGTGIKDVRRKDVGKTLTINWEYVINWPDKYYNFETGPVHTDYLYYVVFEYDTWPTGIRTANIPDAGVTGNTLYTCYRSADGYYKMDYIPEFGADGWSSNSGFHFTSQY